MPCCLLNLRLSPHSRHFQPLGLLRFPKRLSSARRSTRINLHSPYRCSRLKLKPNIQKHGRSLKGIAVQPRMMEEGPVDDWRMSEGPIDYVLSSSDGEDSDGEILLTPINDVDMPKVRKEFIFSEDALTATAHRFAMLGRKRKKYRITYGFISNLGLITFLTVLLALVDWCAWRIVRLPLEPFSFTRPFLVSAILVACAGYVSIPLLKRFDICKRSKKWAPMPPCKKRTPTMGGLFFVPIGVCVALSLVGFSSKEVCGAVAVTLASAAVGLLDDTLDFIRNYHSIVSGWTRFSLEVAVAAWFSLWLDSADISSPYGTAALAFVGMSIAVLPISSDLSIFGASMAGACVGFLMHNRYKASVFMGNIGSLALGGALASMASCTGMFFPLFIACGIFVLESLSVIVQVIFKITKGVQGSRDYLSRILPLHYHLILCRVREPVIVAGTYVISFALAVFAGYVGLISA